MQGVVTKVEVEEPEVRDLPADKPRCAYGESCYRKNTAHFVQMSHPRGVFFSRVQQPAECKSILSIHRLMDNLQTALVHVRLGQAAK